MPKALVGVLGVVVFHTAASARVPRHTRPDPQIQVVLSEAVKPLQPAPSDPPAIQPAISADEVLSIDGLVRPIRTEHEQLLGRLIEDTPDTSVDEKSDLYFRLGELYASQQRHWRLRAGELQLAATRATDAAGKARLGTEATAALNKSKDYLLKTVKIYKALTDNEAFRNYPKLDTVLFYYAYTLQGGRYMKEARAVYDKLLKNYPNSKYVPEAHLAFADYFMEAGQLSDAEARYRMVLKFPKAPVYGFAMYKLGWINLQLQRHQEALESFFGVVQATKSDAKQAKLNRAAQLGFVRAYAEIGKPDKAFSAFERVDRAFAVEMLAHLAQIYIEQGKHDRALYVLRELVTRAPADARVCAWQHTSARAMLSIPGTGTTEVVATIENLVKLHRALETKPSVPAREAQECRTHAAAMSSQLGRAYHAESTKTRNPESLAYAIKLYRAFLDGFPDDPARGEIQYLLAEALWASAAGERNDRLQDERWGRAADAFTEIASRDPSHTDAAYAAALAWMNTLESDAPAEAVDIAKPRRPSPARPLPAREARVIDAIAAYAKTVRDPRHPELGHMRYLEAKLYRRFHHHDKAAPLYVGLVTTHRDAAFAEAAALYALDTLILLQRLDELLLLADKLAADTAFLAEKPELERALRYVRSRSMRR